MKKDKIIIGDEIIERIKKCPKCKTPLVGNKELECPGCGATFICKIVEIII